MDESIQIRANGAEQKGPKLWIAFFEWLSSVCYYLIVLFTFNQYL